MVSDAEGASGRQGWDEFRRIVRTLRLRLEDEARFGRAAVPRASAVPRAAAPEPEAPEAGAATEVTPSATARVVRPAPGAGAVPPAVRPVTPELPERRSPDTLTARVEGSADPA